MTGALLSQRETGLYDLKHIRQFVEERLTALGVAPETIYDLLLVVTEAVTNIIVHGYAGKPGFVEVEIEQQGKDIWMRVSDQAPAFDPTQVSEPDLSRMLEQRDLGGLGVYLIRQSVDQVHYRSIPGGGNELTVVKEGVID